MSSDEANITGEHSSGYAGFNHNQLDNPTDLKAEVTVVNKTYHQPPDSDPTCVESGYSYFLQSDEQPFTRVSSVGEQWIPLEFGWLKDSSRVVISNDGPKRSNVTLPEDVEEERSSRVILLSLRDQTPDVVIRVGHTAEFEPFNIRDVQIRCDRNTVRYTSTVFPR